MDISAQNVTNKSIEATMQSSLVTLPADKPTMLERLAISGIRRKSGFLSRTRAEIVEVFIEFEVLCIISLITCVVSVVCAFSLQPPFIAKFLMLALPVLFLAFLFTPKKRLWSEKLAEHVNRLRENNDLNIPRDLRGLMEILKDAKNPELVILNSLPLSDTLSMMRLTEQLKNMRPVEGQRASLEISGTTSEVLSRLTETLQTRPNTMVLRI